MKKNWKANLKVLWILFKVRVYTLFTKSLKVSFKRVNGSGYCDIPGWPQVYFPNSLMVGDASSLISFLASDDDYITFDVVFSNKYKAHPGYVTLSQMRSSLKGGAYYYGGERFSNVWLCPVTLFVLGQYPNFIYFK
jgi:hypothetical protein